VKDPYDAANDAVESQGLTAPRACPEPVEGAFRMTSFLGHVILSSSAYREQSALIPLK